MAAPKPFVNAMTIDVEDYFQVAAFNKVIAPEKWPLYESRVVTNTHHFLEILEKHQTKATFFVLGYEAERYPELVTEITKAGHEIGSHGYAHQLVYMQTADVFRNDVSRTRKLLQDLSGQEVLSYRAPSFSISTSSTPWARQILVEEGYRYDSSLFPVKHDLYGEPDAPVEIHQMMTPAGPIWEFPATIVKLLGRNFPTGGGGYFRIFPYWLTECLLKKVNQTRPFVFYIHPWEIDPNQPRITGAPLKSRFRHYTNLKKTMARFERLLTTFRFAPLQQVVDQWVEEKSIS